MCAWVAKIRICGVVGHYWSKKSIKHISTSISQRQPTNSHLPCEQLTHYGIYNVCVCDFATSVQFKKVNCGGTSMFSLDWLLFRCVVLILFLYLHNEYQPFRFTFFDGVGYDALVKQYTQALCIGIWILLLQIHIFRKCFNWQWIIPNDSDGCHSKAWLCMVHCPITKLSHYFAT